MSQPVPAWRHPAPPGLVDPGERGSLRLADRVVEKVAVRAATEVDRTADLALLLT